MTEKLTPTTPQNSVTSAQSSGTVHQNSPQIPEWSITDFYKDAWALIKANKKLLILGLVVVMFANGGSSNFSSRSSNNISDSVNDVKQKTDTEFESEPTTLNLDYDYEDDTDMTDAAVTDDELTGLEDEINLEDEAEDQLLDSADEESDDSTESEIAPIKVSKNQDSDLWEATIKPAFKNVPLPIYVLIAVEMVLSVICMIIFGLIVSAWASGVLVKGIGEADQNKHWQLSTVVRDTWTKVKALLWLNWVPWLIFVVALIAAVIVLAVLAGILAAAKTLANSSLFSLLSIILMIALVIAVVIYMIRISLAHILGLRMILLENLTANEAFKKAYNMGRKNTFKMLRLGAVNSIVGALASVVLVLPFIFIIMIVAAAIVPQFDQGFPGFEVILPLILSGGALLMVMGLLMSMFNVIFTTFRAATWHYAYKYLTAYGKK